MDCGLHMSSHYNTPPNTSSLSPLPYLTVRLELPPALLLAGEQPLRSDDIQAADASSLTVADSCGCEEPPSPPPPPDPQPPRSVALALPLLLLLRRPLPPVNTFRPALLASLLGRLLATSAALLLLLPAPP